MPSFEATRLARNNRDWYQLIDLCTIFDTLIGDHQSVYDPKDPNDRLLLGMKGTVVKSPDIQEQQSIELIFSKFKELGSARQTYLWFVEENISVPVNSKRDIEGARRRWQLPSYSFIIQLLHNPFYAGVYAYGRRGSRVKYVDGRIKKTVGHYKPIDQWEVLIKDHHHVQICR